MVKAKTEIKVKGYDHFDQYRAFEFRSLSDDQVGLLHEASLEIMARTGMRFFVQEALELFKKAISIDSEYACAHAWLAQAYFREGLNIWSNSHETSFSWGTLLVLRVFADTL